MSIKDKVLIIAPHIDDEMIGCWSVLNNPQKDVTVLYVAELTEERIAEARTAAALKGFQCYFGDKNSPAHNRAYLEVYVPSRRDWHADHQAVNKMYRHRATHFYSVDMARGILLQDAKTKRDALNQCYPSQAALWEGDHKYWLFEDIQETDYDSYAKITAGGTTVTVLYQHSDWVRTVWLKRECFSQPFGLPGRAEIDALLAHCTGKVTIETPHFKLEA